MPGETTSVILFVGAAGVGKSTLIQSLAARCPDGFSPLLKERSHLTRPELATKVRMAVVVWTHATCPDGEMLEAYVRFWTRRVHRHAHAALPIAVVVTMSDLAPCPLSHIHALQRSKTLHTPRLVPLLTVSARKGTNLPDVWTMLGTLVPAADLASIRANHACIRLLFLASREASARRLHAVTQLQYSARRRLARRRRSLERHYRQKLQLRMRRLLAVLCFAFVAMVPFLTITHSLRHHVNFSECLLVPCSSLVGESGNIRLPVYPFLLPTEADDPRAAPVSPQVGVARRSIFRVRNLRATFRGMLRKPVIGKLNHFLRQRELYQEAGLSTILSRWPESAPRTRNLSERIHWLATRLLYRYMGDIELNESSVHPRSIENQSQTFFDGGSGPSERDLGFFERNMHDLGRTLYGMQGGMHELRKNIADLGSIVGRGIMLFFGWVVDMSSKLRQRFCHPLIAGIGKGVMKIGFEIRRYSIFAGSIYVLARGHMHVGKRNRHIF
ncbi:MAG: hypothetical protein SGPRY_014203 [Prymnesium sp.]